MRRGWLILTVLIVAVGVILTPRAFRAAPGTGMKTAGEMKRALVAEIPAGTVVDEARARLRRRGFRVSPMTDWWFVEEGRTHGHLDYLYGEMSQSSGLVTRRWQVAVVHREGVVTEVLVSSALVGL